MTDPPAYLGETMDSQVESRWPPGLAVMKVSARERLGAPGRPGGQSRLENKKGCGVSLQLGQGTRFGSAAERPGRFGPPAEK